MIPSPRAISTKNKQTLAKVAQELASIQRDLGGVVTAENLSPDSAAAEAVVAIAHARGLVLGAPQAKPRRVVVHFDDSDES